MSKKLFSIAFFVLLSAGLSFGQIYTVHKVDNALDGSHNPLGRTLQTLGNTAVYKSYEQAITTNTVLDVFTDLGRFGSAGFIINDDGATSAEVSFSKDGTNYGDTITVKAGETLDFNVFVLFKTIQIASANISGIRCLVR